MISFMGLYAQNDKELRIKKIKLEILEKAEQYVKLSGVSNEDEKDEFYRLFDSINVLVPNDIMPDNNLKQKLTVTEYTDLIPYYHSLSINASLRPYDVGNTLITDSGTAEFWVDAIKTISSYSKKNNNNYSDTFDIRIIFKVNFYTNQYNITDISLNKERGKYLLISVYNKGLLKKKSMSLDTILINNKKYLLNEAGQFLIKDFTPEIELKPFEEIYFGNYKLTNKDLDFIINHKEFENNKEIYFRQSVFYIEPYISFNSFSGLSPVSSSYIYQENKFSNSYGINIGGVLSPNKKGYWHIITGIKNTNLNYINKINYLSESYNTSDANQVNYLRTNQVSNLQEEHQIQFTTIPILLEKGFNIKRNYCFYVQAGASIVISLKANRYTSSLTSYSGYYKDYYGITIKENGVYDYGNYNLNNSSNLTMVSNLVLMDLGMGISKKISKKTTFKLGIDYQKSFDNIFSESNKKLSTNKSELNSITQTNYSFTVNYLSLHIGLKYNL